jgi:hypothetical protein
LIALNREVSIRSAKSTLPLYSPARKRAFTPKNIKAGFAASGLFPFNPDRVLRSMLLPPAELAIPSADEVRVGSCQQDINVEVQTPVIPVSAEAFISLQNLIIQQDAHVLDKTSKQNLARHLQKSAQSFPKILCHKHPLGGPNSIPDHHQQQSQGSTSDQVIGAQEGKGHEYKDLKEARAKRAVKESTQAAKGKAKRGRKHKSSTPEAEEDDTAETTTTRRGQKRTSAVLEAPEPLNKMAQISNTPEPASALVMQASRTQIAEIAPEPLRAPVVRMW